MKTHPYFGPLCECKRSDAVTNDATHSVPRCEMCRLVTDAFGADVLDRVAEVRKRLYKDGQDPCKVKP